MGQTGWWLLERYEGSNLYRRVTIMANIGWTLISYHLQGLPPRIGDR